MKKHIHLSLITFLFCYCLFSQQKENTSILFVGNSLTFTNNLPKLVKKVAKSKGKKITTEMVAFPNFAIIDHWKGGKVQQLISSKKYDYVIIQQGPSSQLNGRQMLIEDGKKYSDLCKANDVTLCYYMVWPSLQFYQTFDGVIQNYTDAASINEAKLLPVGKLFKAHFDRTKDYSYYGRDGFHPSKKGSKKAAEIIVRYLFL